MITKVPLFSHLVRTVRELIIPKYGICLKNSLITVCVNVLYIGIFTLASEPSAPP
jgi:hypothetical protein